jgi:hypothetical protein
MKFLSLQPFVPSGSNFEASKLLFQELGFSIDWDSGDYVSFKKDDCRFILQKYDNQSFAENFMISVSISDADAFWRDVMDKKLPEKYGIRVSQPTQQPYGKEVNVIDIAGVCWHFVE